MKNTFGMDVGSPTNYLFSENMELNQLNLGNSSNGTFPTGARVVQGSEGGKALKVSIMQIPCADLTAASSKNEEKKTRKMEKKKSSMNIGTWNVMTMRKAGKLKNIKIIFVKIFLWKIMGKIFRK